jgi:uncharacterized membrane protein YbhN (UPF0104 family)
MNKTKDLYKNQKDHKTRRILGFTIKVTVSSVLLYIFLSTVDLTAVVMTLKQTRIHFVIMGVLLYILSILVGAKRWSLFLPKGLSYFRLLSLTFIGSFFNTFLPGIVGGDAVKTYYLYRYTGKGGISLAAVFMDRYMGLSAMACIAFIALIGGYPYIRGTGIALLMFIFLGALVIGSLILWKVNWGRLQFLNAFYTPLMNFKRIKETIYKGFLLGFAGQLISITCVYVLSHAIGLKVPAVYFFMFLPIINGASSVPVSIAGLGIREAGFVILFSKIGLTQAEAISLSILVFTTICLTNLVGGIEYLRAGKPPKL